VIIENFIVLCLSKSSLCFPLLEEEEEKEELSASRRIGVWCFFFVFPSGDGHG
jgi:hypothetical protein